MRRRARRGASPPGSSSYAIAASQHAAGVSNPRDRHLLPERFYRLGRGAKIAAVGTLLAGSAVLSAAVQYAVPDSWQTGLRIDTVAERLLDRLE